MIASYQRHGSSSAGIPQYVPHSSASSTPVSRALTERKVIVIRDRDFTEETTPDFDSHGAVSNMVYPVLSGEKPIGVMGFSSDTANKFSAETVQLMSAIIGTVGMLMENISVQDERVSVDEKIARLAQALDFTDDAVVLLDAQGNLEYMNKAAQEFGGDSAVIRGHGDGQNPESGNVNLRNRPGGILSQASEGNWSGEVRLSDKAGTPVDISLSTNDVMDDQKKTVGQITVGRNITRSRRMQEDLLRLSREREIEANIARIVSSPLEISDVFNRFSQEFENIISFDLLSITGVDLEKEIFIESFLYQEGERAYFLDSGDPYHGTVAGAAVELGRCVVYDSNDKDLPTDTLDRTGRLVDSGMTSFLGVPLVTQDRIVGALAIARKGEPYTEQDQERVTRIGSLIAGALSGYILQRAKAKAEAEAVENETRFLQIAENLRGGFWLSDLRPHKVLYNSPSNGRVWGIPAEELNKGWHVMKARIHPEDVDRVDKSLKESHQTGELDEEFRIFLPDGSTRWLSDRGFPILDESGEVYRMAGFVEDITDRKDSDFRLAESERLASIGELSAGVAHEINNPLTSIVLYSQMLLDEDIPDEIRNDLQVVSSQAYRAAKIVRNLLQFARKSDPEKRPLSIGWLIRRSLEMKSHEFNINSITVIENVPDDLPLILMDEHLILQVLLNVLTNAEQACASAHGRGNITVSVSNSGGLVDIAIQDDGPGISTDEMAKIFQPFFTTKETGLGTGLGLSVSHGILVQHEGNIWAESELGSGTTIHIELPLTADMDLTTMTTDPKPESVTGSGRSTSHVLVVDDEADLRAVLIKQFELRRYNVDQAGDGEEAWRKLQSLDYDCILLDLRMPGMGGQELYEKISFKHPDLIRSIIFITGDTVNPATKAFLSGVTNPVMSKPFDFRELEQLVVSVINRGNCSPGLNSGHAEPGITSTNY